MNATKLALGAVVMASLYFTGCSRYGNELQYVEYGEHGTISIQLTDAPFPHKLLSEANVTIVKIDARRKGVEGEDDAFETLYEGDESVNLLELTNGITKSMGEVEVPVGSYDLVKVYIKESSIGLLDGTLFNLDIPNGSETGTISFINRAISVESDAQSDLLLDFDVSRSFILEGGLDIVSEITGFAFKPVFKSANMANSGTLTGTVKTSLLGQLETDLPGVQISVMVADTLNTTTFTDVSGAYTVLGLDPGQYTVTAEILGFSAETVEDVVIVEDDLTNQDFDLNIGL